MLPLDSAPQFPSLFEALEQSRQLGIESFAISMTNLEEVFLKLEETGDHHMGASADDGNFKRESVNHSLESFSTETVCV